MMSNQRGGILSKLFIIPVGVAFMVGFFFLGYYVGKYQSKSDNRTETIPPLPEVVSEHLPRKEDFTFYKTLTDKDNKTVSIDLKPKPATEEKASGEKTQAANKKAEQPKKEKKAENKPEAKPEKTVSITAKEPEPKQQQSSKEQAARETNPKIRYTLQIASYQEKQMAEEDVKKMKQRGYAAFIVATDLQDKGTWYRVRLGSFSSKASAEKLQKELHSKAGISPYITTE